MKIDNDFRLYSKARQTIENLDRLYTYLKPSDTSLVGGCYQELNDLKNFYEINELNLNLNTFNKIKKYYNFFDKNLYNSAGIEREKVIAIHKTTLYEIECLIRDLETLKTSLAD